MSDRHYATDAKGAKQNKVTQEPRNEEDLPPPYPGIPGAYLTGGTAPLRHPLVAQPRAQPLVSQPGYYPQPAPSAPHEQDSSLRTGPQTSYEPHETYYEGSHSEESCLIPPYPGQRRAAAPGSCTPALAHDGSYYPTYVHPVAMGPAHSVPPARSNNDCCDCNTCMLCTVIGCECLRALLEVSK